MKSIFSCLLFVVGSLFGFGNDAQGATVSVFVPGSANPYLAGMPNGTTATIVRVTMGPMAVCSMGHFFQEVSKMASLVYVSRFHRLSVFS